MIRIYLVCFAYITLLQNFVSPQMKSPWSVPPIRLIDYEKKDLFFDRVVFFTLDVFNITGDKTINKHVTSGVLIEADRVLTSYNAFRNLTNSPELLDKIYVCYVVSRTVKPPEKTFYTYECVKVLCGRPIIPMKDNDVREDQWHGPDKKHSPLHDLMVVKLNEKLDIWIPERDYTYDERHSPQQIAKELTQRAGPLLTKLGAASETLRKDIKFVSLGLSTKRNVRRYYKLEIGEYEDSENVVVNCDEWLPRSWGYFFCLANDADRFAGFASGALLFSEKKLFGVGSFSMWRGKYSILVFTDIRPYLTHIWNTCTDRDLH